ncbi:hypothetical protein BJX68DRAFT_240234 [Aspergillus pseudodeflectus]|uniref:Uncharacterized protein n=1 Tax=Aspergillus pseudodeflectus TaxID=176178 RepID=A0ABR4K4F7_9EURO
MSFFRCIILCLLSYQGRCMVFLFLDSVCLCLPYHFLLLFLSFLSFLCFLFLFDLSVFNTVTKPFNMAPGL